MVERLPAISPDGVSPLPGLVGLDADGVLDRVTRNRRLREALEADDLACADSWADLHGHIDGDDADADDLPAVRNGRERLIRLGGDETPRVAEFAPAELGAVLGVSS